MTNAQTKVIAHRGFSGVAPENTLAAFQKAIEAGADYFELDVHTTKDDSLVVIHDTTVNRTAS
ncbi:MAG: glycerophosphodiester phosphodiesterase, partial [Cyclobacteriaceae bacterium]|nr:glycerophosphodiester phosphodiesterase [Cyclobacteriaceae bacterium]